MWYQENLPEVLISFSQAMSVDRPPNLRLMSSFPTPILEPDGVHLTSFSGLEYLIHLFDASELIIEGLGDSPEDVLLSLCESTRVLEDRVLVLEKEHQRLNKIVEHKIAIDAELADYRENERSEDCFMIEGLPLIPSTIFSKEWQVLATKHVKEVVVPLMGKDCDIVVVQNATARHQGAEVKYCVKLSSTAESKAIRRKFGSLFVGGDHRPPHLKKIAIRNRVTPETTIRRSIMQLLGARYKASNPGSKVQVIGFDPRPLLKITPASSASDRRMKLYNFIEAVKTLPTNFSSAETAEILKKINNPKLVGRMRFLFIVLSDDEYRQKMSKINPKEPKSDQSSSSEGNPPSGAGDSTPDPHSSSSSGSGSQVSSKGKFGGKSGGSGSGGRSGSSGSKNLKRVAESDTSLESNPSKK